MGEKVAITRMFSFFEFCGRKTTAFRVTVSGHVTAHGQSLDRLLVTPSGRKEHPTGPGWQ